MAKQSDLWQQIIGFVSVGSVCSEGIDERLKKQRRLRLKKTFFFLPVDHFVEAKAKFLSVGVVCPNKNKYINFWSIRSSYTNLEKQPNGGFYFINSESIINILQAHRNKHMKWTEFSLQGYCGGRMWGQIGGRWWWWLCTSFFLLVDVWGLLSENGWRWKAFTLTVVIDGRHCSIPLCTLLYPLVPWGMSFFYCTWEMHYFNLEFGHHGNTGFKQLSGQIGLGL